MPRSIKDTHQHFLLIGDIPQGIVIDTLILRIFL